MYQRSCAPSGSSSLLFCASAVLPASPKSAGPASQRLLSPKLEREGSVTRLGRGLYQLADAAPEVNHSLAEAAKRVPKGVICLVSALAFHGITDQMPRRVWIAISPKDWKPQIDYPPLRIVRFADKFLGDGVETHDIEGVRVPIFGVAKTIADAFPTPPFGWDRRHCPRAQRGAAPAQNHTIRNFLMRNAQRRRNALRPYLEAFTVDG